MNSFKQMLLSKATYIRRIKTCDRLDLQTNALPTKLSLPCPLLYATCRQEQYGPAGQRLGPARFRHLGLLPLLSRTLEHRALQGETGSSRQPRDKCEPW